MNTATQIEYYSTVSKISGTRSCFSTYGEASAMALRNGEPVRFHYTDGTTLDQI